MTESLVIIFFFQRDTLKGTTKAPPPPVDLVSLEHPKRYDEYPLPLIFIWEYPLVDVTQWKSISKQNKTLFQVSQKLHYAEN